MLILMQGVSGSGKSHIANAIANAEDLEVVSADNYMTVFTLGAGWLYQFDPSRLGVCHKYCREMAEEILMAPQNRGVIVDNTNTTKAEAQPYLDMAKKYGHKVQVVRVDSHDFDDIHGVPDETKRRQRLRMQNLLD